MPAPGREMHVQRRHCWGRKRRERGRREEEEEEKEENVREEG